MRGSLISQKLFFSEGIKKLVQRWKKCIEKQGDYVEKWCYCKFYIFIEIKFASVVRMIIDSHTYIGLRPSFPGTQATFLVVVYGVFVTTYQSYLQGCS